MGKATNTQGKRLGIVTSVVVLIIVAICVGAWLVHWAFGTIVTAVFVIFGTIFACYLFGPKIGDWIATGKWDWDA